MKVKFCMTIDRNVLLLIFWNLCTRVSVYARKSLLRFNKRTSQFWHVPSWLELLTLGLG